MLLLLIIVLTVYIVYLLQVQLSAPTAAVYEPKTLFISKIPVDLERGETGAAQASNQSAENVIATCIREASETVLGRVVCTAEIRLKRHMVKGTLEG